VQDDRITGLIDWQDVWVGPLFLQARPPRLVRYDGEVMLKLPERYDDLKDDDDEKTRIRDQVECSIVQFTYDSETKSTNPLAHAASNINQARTRRDTVDFSGNTWDGDIVPFRQCLIRITRYV